MNEKIMQSYVYRETGDNYFVSTVNRESSAMGAYGDVYAETMVWSLDEKGERKEIVMQEADTRDSIKRHLKVCEELFHNGIYKGKE